MSKSGGIVVAVVNVDSIAVAGIPAGLRYSAVAGGINGSTDGSGEVHTVVVLRSAVNGVDSPTVARCHLSHVFLRDGLNRRDVGQSVAVLVNGFGEAVE